MKPNYVRNLTKWLIPIACLILLLASVSVWLILRPFMHTAPSALTLSTCRDVTSGMRRLGSKSSVQFDLPSKDFDVSSWMNDMPPALAFRARSRSDHTAWLEISAGMDAIMSSRELTSSIPTVSRYVGERDVYNSDGRQVGKDHWGYLKSGERWRYLEFSWGSGAAYRPARPNQAKLFDQAISTGCILPGSGLPGPLPF
jgi:hypothetical protein